MFQFLRAVFFDVDGVLIDSLPQHLKICRDKAEEFKLPLEIPSIEEFRDAISRGLKVSPMREFFLAIGFSASDADRAVLDYEHEFMERYRPPTFAGVDEMLRKLRNNNLTLGIVTSNTRENVEPALPNSFELFDEACRFFHDPHSAPRRKSWYLAEGARNLGADPSTCVYIGDQPADVRAAEEAGFRFLGVTYGWGIRRDDPCIETVDTIDEIPEKLATWKTQAT
jgi:beta-phosphoglucomutase-like phosphatase (HAD superfamily)